MKRTITTISLFFITLTICISGAIFLNNTVNSFIKDINTSIKNVSENNVEFATNLNNNIIENWEKNKILISTFINHERLEEIDRSLLSMKTYLLYDQIEDFFVQSEIVKSQLNYLRDTELPSLKNIL